MQIPDFRCYYSRFYYKLIGAFFLVGMTIGCNTIDEEGSVNIRRFEKDLFGVDVDSIEAGAEMLNKEYPVFFPVFVEGILGIGKFDDSLKAYMPIFKAFLKNDAINGLYDSCMAEFSDISSIEHDLGRSFDKLHYYFPVWKEPQVITFLSEFSRAAVTYDTLFLGIGLDMYLGKDYVYYPSLGFPNYIIRKFSKEYIIPNSINVVLTNMFETDSEQNKLIDKMIYNGKILHLMDLILEDTPDSLIMGYTEAQLEWCKGNELQIWAFFIDKDLLFSSNSLAYNKFVSDGPTSSGMPPESPGNIGSWVGWQIVRKFMRRNEEVTLQQLMMDFDGTQVLNRSGYKPKDFGY